ncbi:hypothetical protein CYY_001070 [Polysphondylium violaceum]|uniref:Major facilitator superfamily (MFS) profile domain-containing protein n=1 Tax=Polysphondylium violaceum TaxID=133409 RepID=A0A8J4Q3Q0_9MYCE|nr:hypothetical protein CYY_001070 [Polysphondylium violaceum]
MVAFLNRIVDKPWFVVYLSCLGGLIFGYNTGIIVGGLGPIADKFDLGTIMQGVVVCSILLGALLGSVSSGFIADKIGRKPVIFFTAIATIGGSIGSAVATNVATICVLRLILGLGVGCASSVCPLMVAETTPQEKKGIYGAFFQISITVGIFLANIIALALKKIGESNWRWMFALGAVPGVLMFFVWIIIKESPIYLEKKNRINQSAEVQKKSSFSILFSKQNRKPMFIGFLLATLSQLTGINAFMYFSTTIFKDAGISGEYGPDIAAIILQFWNVATTLIALFAVNKVGRRVLLLTGSSVMTVCDLVIGLVFLVASGSARGWVAIVFLFIFIAGFESSIGVLFWFVINEIMDEDAKNIGAPIINALQWLFNLLLSFFFLSVVQYLGQYVMFFIFGGIGIFCTLFLKIYLPNLNAPSTTTVQEQIHNNNTVGSDEYFQHEKHSEKPLTTPELKADQPTFPA